MKKVYVIGSVVVILILSIVLLLNLGASVIDYVSIDEAKKSPVPVQVAGVIIENSIVINKDSRSISLVICDTSGSKMEVEYNGIIPSNMDNANKIVVIGKYDPGRKLFVAHKMLVKCPTKYNQRLEDVNTTETDSQKK